MNLKIFIFLAITGSSHPGPRLLLFPYLLAKNKHFLHGPRCAGRSLFTRIQDCFFLARMTIDLNFNLSIADPCTLRRNEYRSCIFPISRSGDWRELQEARPDRKHSSRSHFRAPSLKWPCKSLKLRTTA